MGMSIPPFRPRFSSLILSPMPDLSSHSSSLPWSGRGRLCDGRREGSSCAQAGTWVLSTLWVRLFQRDPGPGRRKRWFCQGGPKRRRGAGKQAEVRGGRMPGGAEATPPGGVAGAGWVRSALTGETRSELCTLCLSLAFNATTCPLVPTNPGAHSSPSTSAQSSSLAWILVTKYGKGSQHKAWHRNSAYCLLNELMNKGRMRMVLTEKAVPGDFQPGYEGAAL